MLCTYIMFTHMSNSIYLVHMYNMLIYISHCISCAHVINKLKWNRASRSVTAHLKKTKTFLRSMPDTYSHDIGLAWNLQKILLMKDWHDPYQGCLSGTCRYSLICLVTATYSRLSLSRIRLSRITAYLEEKIWSLF